ncbi:MAG: hypothetical protein Q8R10_07055 [Pseudomonas sp.]|uniref:hypothetical protein n=1 Tax=Pseudomonas sp. TaxID=306 RepID=UPI00273294AF|nr:hypothetical protein [Pseudomonas sp.]MDP3846170.1 hypothetical protein [Pseudomonas sp.]
MVNKVAVSAFCLMLLVGCDDSKKVDGGQSVVSEHQAEAEKKANKTAIYFPGGSGIDFGMVPVSDKVLEDKNGKYRVAVYKFKESFDVVDASVSTVLTADGYARKFNAPGNNKLSVTYLKSGKYGVLFRYATVVRSDVESKTFVTVSWRI